MEAFKEQLVNEFSELNDRTNNLFKFINNNNGVFNKMEFIDQQLLRQQYHCMVAYENCLVTIMTRLFNEDDIKEISNGFNERVEKMMKDFNNETI